MGFAGKFSLTDLQNLGLNQTKDSSSGCVPNFPTSRSTAESNGFGYPNNGEFDYSDTGAPCNMCAFSYGDDSCTGAIGSPIIAGHRPAVIRKSFHGDPTNCCQTGNLLDSSGNTCDPIYQNSDNCTTALTNYCNNTDNVSSAKCSGFIQKHGKDQFLDTINAYCKKGDNVKGTFCQTMKNAGTDQIVTDYCKANPNDNSFCGCYNLSSDYVSIIDQLAAKGQTLTPWCSLKTCATNSIAYKPYSWDGTCPSNTICLQSINVGSAKTTDFSNINFSCTNNTSTNNVSVGTSILDKIKANLKITFIVTTIVIVIVIVIVIILSSKT